MFEQVSGRSTVAMIRSSSPARSATSDRDKRRVSRRQEKVIAGSILSVTIPTTLKGSSSIRVKISSPPNTPNFNWCQSQSIGFFTMKSPKMILTSSKHHTLSLQLFNKQMKLTLFQENPSIYKAILSKTSLGYTKCPNANYQQAPKFYW